MDALRLIHNINTVIINPIIMVIFGLALLIFVYGVYEYVAGSASEEARDTGRRHIIFGLIGLFIMFSVFALLQIITGTIGADNTPITQITK